MLVRVILVLLLAWFSAVLLRLLSGGRRVARNSRSRSAAAPGPAGPVGYSRRDIVDTRYTEVEEPPPAPPTETCKAPEDQSCL